MLGALTDTTALSEDLVTLVVAVSGLVVVSLWWMARRFARGAEDPLFGDDPDQ